MVVYGDAMAGGLGARGEGSRGHCFAWEKAGERERERGKGRGRRGAHHSEKWNWRQLESTGWCTADHGASAVVPGAHARE